MNDRKGIENLIPFSERTEEEAREIGRKGGIASGKARRAKADMKRLLETALSAPMDGSEMTYAERITMSMITIAANPKYGGAAVRAYERILHTIGQDEPERHENAIEVLKEILEVNKENARVRSKR